MARSSAPGRGAKGEGRWTIVQGSNLAGADLVEYLAWSRATSTNGGIRSRRKAKRLNFLELGFGALVRNGGDVGRSMMRSSHVPPAGLAVGMLLGLAAAAFAPPAHAVWV